MTMKKVAFFVEGQTEADFVVKYLKEITSKKGLVTVREGKGGKKFPRVFTQTYQDGESGRDYQIDIYVSGADNRVNSDILDNLNTLGRSGFELVIGLRDLRGQKNDQTAFTLADLPTVENVTRMMFSGKNPPVKSSIAVMEVETWFMAETNHYQTIDPMLTETVIKANIATTGVDPYIDDLTQVVQPAETLDAIYKLVGKSYDKTATVRQATVDALDYANLYINVPARLAKFDEFARMIDSIF